MRLRGRRSFLRNRRTLNWVRRVKRALVAGQRKNPAQPALAMLQSRAPDFMIAMDLCEQVGGPTVRKSLRLISRTYGAR